MIEEPLMRIQANDDQGIASLELVLSVNGEDQRVVPLLPGAQASIRNQQVEAEHVVYLEDLGLQPGDLVSYYVQARDRAPQAKSRTATSDIFFYQVRPFSTDYRSAEQGGGNGGGGGGQGGQQQGHLSEQQKQFVIATFKMIRDRDQYSDEAWRENLEVLANAEARIRDRVEAIVRRIRGRAIVRVDERYQVVLEELPRAASVMVEVEESLAATEIETALADAQVALKHLQRADAAFREINVSLARQRGGGADGAARAATAGAGTGYRRDAGAPGRTRAAPAAGSGTPHPATGSTRERCFRRQPAGARRRTRGNGATAGKADA
jgi:hypothetical protein